jgi:hypothetical protein
MIMVAFVVWISEHVEKRKTKIDRQLSSKTLLSCFKEQGLRDFTSKKVTFKIVEQALFMYSVTAGLELEDITEILKQVR